MVSRLSDSECERIWTLRHREGRPFTYIAQRTGRAVDTITRYLNGDPTSSGYQHWLEKTRYAVPSAQELDQLGPNARRAHADFGYFRERYMGRISVPWQLESIEIAMDLLADPEDQWLVVNAPPGSGKALDLDTPIPTPFGWTTIKDIEPGMSLFDENGEMCRVVAKSEVFYGHDCYEVTTDDGATLVADADHQWLARINGHGQYGSRPSPLPDYAGKTGPKPESSDGRKIYTTEFLARPRNKRPQIPVTAPLHYPTRILPIAPYVLGVWLGDGNSRGGSISCHADDETEIRSWVQAAGYETTDRVGGQFGVLGLQKQLREANLLQNKHIPEAFMRSDIRQRLALLQGLIDTDGHVDPRGQVEFTNTNRWLADHVHELVLSLGVKAGFSEGRATLNGKDYGPKYRITFMMAGAARLTRKRRRCRDGERTPHRYLTITPTESVPTQCIQVDSPSGLFLAGEGMIVTHNSMLYTVDLQSWLIVRDRAIRVMVGSGNHRMASRYTGLIRTFLSAPTPIRPSVKQIRAGLAVEPTGNIPNDFGDFKPSTSAMWRKDEFFVAQPDDLTVGEKDPTVSAWGRDSVYLGTRVDSCVWDDLVTPDSVATPESREKLAQEWDDYMESRIEPGGLMILAGQRLHADDLYRHVLDKNVTEFEATDATEYQQYTHIIYPAHDETACVGQHDRDAPPQGQGGCLLDPKRLSWHKLWPKMQPRSLERFKVVYQQQDIDPGKVLVPEWYLTGGEGPDRVLYPGCYDHHRDLLECPVTTRVVSRATVDPSSSRWWSIQWWIYDPATSTHYLMDLDKEKYEAPDLLERNPQDGNFYGIMEEWQTRSEQLGFPIDRWIVETNSAQRYLLQYRHVYEWMSHRGVEIAKHETGMNKLDKNLGPESLRELYKFGRVNLPMRSPVSQRQVGYLTKELMTWPEATTEDQVMAQWFFTFDLQWYQEVEEDTTSQWRPSWMAAANA